MQGRKHQVKGELVPYSAKIIHNIHRGIISPTLAYASVKGAHRREPLRQRSAFDKSVRAVTRDETCVCQGNQDLAYRHPKAVAVESKVVHAAELGHETRTAVCGT